MIGIGEKEFGMNQKILLISWFTLSHLGFSPNIDLKKHSKGTKSYIYIYIVTFASKKKMHRIYLYLY